MVSKVTKEAILLEDPNAIAEAIDKPFLKSISGRKVQFGWYPHRRSSTPVNEEIIKLIKKPIKLEKKNSLS